jgi:PAS domain S-box-containing protein
LNRLKNISIKNKLIIIILAIVFSSVIILFSTFIIKDVRFFKNEMVAMSKMTAKIVGVDCVPPLTFDDAKGGYEILQKLKDIETIEYACVFNDKRKIFASFGKVADSNAFSFMKSSSVKFSEKNLYVLEPIEYNGQKYGDIFLSLSTSQLQERTREHIFIMSLISLTIILISYFLALWFRQLILKPILSLANVTEGISKSADYSQRVKKTSSDEIGILYDSFNNMLEQIHLRQKERNVAEKALYESEAKYRNYINSAPHGIIVTDEDGNFIEVNDTLCKMTGYTHEELLTKTVSTITTPGCINEVLISYGELKKKGKSAIETEIINKNGEIRYWEVTAIKLSEQRFLGFTIDITERRRSSEALKKSEKTLSKAQEIAHIGSWEWNLKTRHFKWSDEMYQLFSFDPDSELKLKSLKMKIHPDDRGYVMEVIKKTRQGIVVPYIEFKVLSSEKEERYITVMAESVFDETGNVEFITGIAQDVTERKKNEERIKNQNILLEKAVINKTQEMEKMIEKMISQEKLATIGKVSGSIAHEIRNPLGAVKQSVFYLQGQLKNQSEKVQNHLKLMDEELTITDRVITNLLEMTRLGDVNKEQLNIKNLINQAARRIEKGTLVKLVYKISDDAKFVWADPLQMQQVFVNLITNSAQAMENKGEILIQSEQKQSSIKITLSDSGPGMKKDDIKKAFEPLFTTKAKGTGLGLSICKQIIDNHGGDIKINSVPKKGTTVSIILPVLI